MSQKYYGLSADEQAVLVSINKDCPFTGCVPWNERCDHCGVWGVWHDPSAETEVIPMRRRAS